MEQGLVRHRSWQGQLFMVLSILVVCVGVPMVFVFAGSFTAWLAATGVHATPNLAGGSSVAQFSRFDRRIVDPALKGAAGEIEAALALRKFSVRKVAFRPLSGIGIAPRLNLVFEFDGKLPDPQNSSANFSATAIHVYIKVPGKASETASSDRVANVDFGGQGWNHQVIIDGFHDQARIFDTRGNMVGRGIGLFVDYGYAAARDSALSSKRRIERTTVTAALPMDIIGDPAQGDWFYYVLVGLADSRHPSMILHSARDGSVSAFSRAVPEGSEQASPEGSRLRLLPLAVSNRD